MSLHYFYLSQQLQGTMCTCQVKWILDTMLYLFTTNVIVDNKSKISQINCSLSVLVSIRMLDGDERRGTQDTISRNELAPTNRRDKQKRKKKKRRQKNVVAERSESD